MPPLRAPCILIVFPHEEEETEAQRLVGPSRLWTEAHSSSHI